MKQTKAKGNVIKVKQKHVSAILATSLAFSMFTFPAFAADVTTSLDTEGKFEALKTAGIFHGYPDGSPHLEANMTRAEFAKALAALLHLTSDASAAASFTDVPANHWAIGEIGALTQKKIIEGIAVGKFGPKLNVTIEQVAKIAVSALGLGPKADAVVEGKTSAWATGYVAAAIEAGLISTSADYTALATRGDLVDTSFMVYQKGQTLVTVKSAVAVDASNVEVSFSDDSVEKAALTTPLVVGTATDLKVIHNGVEYTVSVTLAAISATAAQTDAKEITVTFSRALSESEMSAAAFDLKAEGSSIAKTVTRTWAADHKSVLLKAVSLPEGKYILTVNGQAISISIAEAVATRMDITATNLRQSASEDAGVVIYNQFNKVMDNIDFNLTVADVTSGKEANVDSNYSFDLSDQDVYKVGDSIVVTAVCAQTGLVASKTFQLAAGSAVTSMLFGKVEPLEDEARVTTNKEGYVLPYTFTDQYGKAVTLDEASKDVTSTNGTAELSGITFLVSNKAIITDLEVDSEGKLTFNTGDVSGTVTITAINSTTGAPASTTIEVYENGIVGKVVLGRPDVVVINEEAAFAFEAFDSFNEGLAYSGVTLGEDIDFRSNLQFASGYPRYSASGQLLFKFTQSGSGYVMVTNAAGTVVANIPVTVKDTPAAQNMNDVANVPAYYTIGGTAEFDTDNVTYYDEYGRTHNLSSLTADNVEMSTDGVVSLITDGSNIKGIEGVSTGTVTLTIYYPGDDHDNPAIRPRQLKLTVIDADKVSSYTINTTASVSTIYSHSTFTSNTAAAEYGDDPSGYVQGIKVTGKYKDKDVAVPQSKLSYLTSSREDIVAIGSDEKSIYGYAGNTGTSTITAYDEAGNILGTKEITASNAAPAVIFATFWSGEYTLTVGATQSFGFFNGLYIINQYGVQFNPSSFKLASSNSDIVSVDNTTHTITAKSAGDVTLTFRSSNGVVAATTIKVNE